MKKRILCILLALVCLCSTALADVIYEPENAFYEHHRDECEYVSRNYIVPESGAEVCVKPGGKPLGSYAAGESVYVDYLYTDPNTGERWGLCQFYGGKGWEDGWVCLTGLQVVYDYRDFAADHGEAFYEPAEDEVPAIELSETVTVLWPYPGAAKPDTEITPEQADGLPLQFWTLFDDEAGRTWGYLGYWRGWRNKWVCLSDPSAAELPPRETPVVTVAPSEVQREDAKTLFREVLPWLGVALAISVSGSALFIILLKRKYRKAHPTQGGKKK